MDTPLKSALRLGFAAGGDLFAQRSSAGALTFYTAGETPRAPRGLRAFWFYSLLVLGGVVGRLASSPPADYKSALPACRVQVGAPIPCRVQVGAPLKAARPGRLRRLLSINHRLTQMDTDIGWSLAEGLLPH